MPKTILAVLAHPDDETFGLGGTLALYARKGFDTYYVCATRGEAGTVNAEYLNGFKDTAELRTNELMRAAKILGLKKVFFLDYRDSGMPGTEENKHPDAQINHSIDEVAGKVVKYIRELKPEVVITFDPIGGYKHLDHIHIQKATVLAFEKANDASFHPEAGSPFKPRALYFQVFSCRILRWAVRLMPLFGKDPTKFGLNKDVNLRELAEEIFLFMHAWISPQWPILNVRQAASTHRREVLKCAADGLGLITRLLGEREEFMRVYPPVTDSHYKVSNDLFIS